MCSVSHSLGRRRLGDKEASTPSCHHRWEGVGSSDGVGSCSAQRRIPPLQKQCRMHGLLAVRGSPASSDNLATCAEQMTPSGSTPSPPHTLELCVPLPGRNPPASLKGTIIKRLPMTASYWHPHQAHPDEPLSPHPCKPMLPVGLPINLAAHRTSADRSREFPAFCDVRASRA